MVTARASLTATTKVRTPTAVTAAAGTITAVIATDMAIVMVDTITVVMVTGMAIVTADTITITLPEPAAVYLA